MKTGTQDTIFALASGGLPSGIAVMRISGPASRFALETMCGGTGEPRYMRLAPIRSAAGELLDRGLAAWFPGPHSFTGEDYAELHLHGGMAVVAAVSDALAGIDGLRSAEAGEFSMRAFNNGKIDLTGAEALGDLIDAQTEEQRRFALFNAGEAPRLLYDRWRSSVIETMALMMAEIDFADDSDAAGNVDQERSQRLRQLAEEIDSHVKQYRVSEIIREGFKVVIAGAPNAGKSSLINALAGREVAIVTNSPGTTRDVVEVALDLGGRKVVLSDTAGLRESDEPVEQIGMERARQSAKSADLVIWLYDSSVGDWTDMMPETEAPVLRVANKIDLLATSNRESENLLVSVTENIGLDALIAVLADAASKSAITTGAVPFRRRHVLLLKDARDALLEASAKSDDLIELQAEALRHAANCLGKITGQVDVEDLLEVIFSRFCIGK